MFLGDFILYKRYKRESGYSYSLGMAVTIELLFNKPEFVKEIYVHSKLYKNDSYDFISNICAKRKIEIIENDRIFNVLSPKENCYVIGRFMKYNENVNKQNSNIVLVNPSNAGNLGTIIRSCKGFTIEDLIIIGGSVDIFHPKVIRSSMGSIFNVKINCFETFKQYKEMFNNHNFYVFVLKTDNFLGSINFMHPFSLVFGNEADGLLDEYKNYGKPVRINHSSKIDSLNLSNAVSIVLYEVSRQNNI